MAVSALLVLRVVSCDLMTATVADELISSKAHPCVTWSKKEALDRCVNFETWTKDIPAVVNNAISCRRLATCQVSDRCASFGLAFVWDPALLSIPACSSFKLPKSSHLVYKLRHMLESVLSLKYVGVKGDIYSHESSLLALRAMPASRLTDWKALLKAILNWGKATMALIHVAHHRRNVFAPEFLEMFRLAFVPVIHDGWSVDSVRKKSCMCEIIAALPFECWSSAHSFVFPRQILYVLCIPFTKLTYAGYSENPKRREWKTTSAR